MKKYVVYRNRTSMTSFNPEPMTAEAVEKWIDCGTSWYNPEVKFFETLEEARAAFENEQPSSYWERSYGNRWVLEVEYYELLEDEYDEDGELAFENLLASAFAPAKF